MTLGEEIRRARERLQMTQPQLAAKIGVSETTISNWERNLSTPKNRMGRLREVLQMDTPPPDNTTTRGVLLKDATFAETIAHLMTLYGRAVRGDTEGATPSITLTERLPPKEGDPTRPHTRGRLRPDTGSGEHRSG
ncbi:helix-turn-helix transcriptional regulator [Pseudonocardia hispaniensis]|uniref:Helix-turn-helix transcriptional regulator n=1 Tax=Pseudonocardia hispaniensis TaxID=904933 RepID=A0ABW1J7M8_9PSEU